MKRTIPEIKILFLPIESLSSPSMRTLDASAMRNILETQLTSAKETLNSAEIFGKASVIEDVVNGVKKDAVVVASSTRESRKFLTSLPNRG